MRASKYLLYPAALVVAVWSINGVTTSQPDKPSKPGQVLEIQDNGSSTTTAHQAGMASIAVANTTVPGR